MTNHFCGPVAAALLASAVSAALAQSAPAKPASGASSGAAAVARPAASASYESAFDGYRRFDEQQVLPWRESNDLVRRIGGWQAYAREAAGSEAAPEALAAPAPASSAAKPGSAPPSAHHRGHSAPKSP